MAPYKSKILDETQLLTTQIKCQPHVGVLPIMYKGGERPSIL